MRELIDTAAAGPEPVVVPVRLGARAYDVLIGPGLLPRAGEIIAARFKGALAVVSDETVARLHGRAVADSLAAAGRLKGEIAVPPGERSKGFDTLAPLVSKLLRLGVERGDLVLALGGGVIGDLAGFAAGILRRGVRFVQVPTSLLAQVDSSVGGKTGINTPEGKNLIGVFHQPSLVLADTDVLATLPKRELAAGFAEVIKYGALGDAPFFSWLEANAGRVLKLEADPLLHAVATSVRMKAGVVERDETETGERQLLNLGHTFGHALESATGYSDRLLHGEGVAVGMAMAARLSAQRGLCSPDDARRLERLIEASGLPCRLAHVRGLNTPPEHLLELMRQDKKVKAGRMTLILIKGLGQAFATTEVEPAELLSFLAGEARSP